MVTLLLLLNEFVNYLTTSNDVAPTAARSPSSEGPIFVPCSRTFCPTSMSHPTGLKGTI